MEKENEMLNTLKSIDSTLKSIEQILKSKPLSTKDIFEEAKKCSKDLKSKTNHLFY